MSFPEAAARPRAVEVRAATERETREEKKDFAKLREVKVMRTVREREREGDARVRARETESDGATRGSERKREGDSRHTQDKRVGE